MLFMWIIRSYICWVWGKVWRYQRKLKKVNIQNEETIEAIIERKPKLIGKGYSQIKCQEIGYKYSRWK